MADRLLEAKAKAVNDFVFKMKLHEADTNLAHNSMTDLLPLGRGAARVDMCDGMDSVPSDPLLDSSACGGFDGIEVRSGAGGTQAQPTDAQYSTAPASPNYVSPRFASRHALSTQECVRGRYYRDCAPSGARGSLQGATRRRSRGATAAAQEEPLVDTGARSTGAA